MWPGRPYLDVPGLIASLRILNSGRDSRRCRLLRARGMQGWWRLPLVLQPPLSQGVGRRPEVCSCAADNNVQRPGWVRAAFEGMPLGSPQATIQCVTIHDRKREGLLELCCREMHGRRLRQKDLPAPCPAACCRVAGPRTTRVWIRGILQSAIRDPGSLDSLCSSK